MNENDFEKIESMIARHVGTFADSIQHKLDIVVEGHQMLSEKIDRVEARLDSRIDCVVRKLDAVAAETSANTIAIRGLTAGKRSQGTQFQYCATQDKSGSCPLKYRLTASTRMG